MNASGEGVARRRDELPSAAAVQAFLRANPAFLVDHPELLRELELDHDAAGAVSLVERQVAVLREDNERLKARFRELVQLAEANETLIRRVHEIALLLMQATGPEAIFAALDDRLRRDFGADRVALTLFAEPAFVAGDLPARFEGADCAARELFREVLAARLPSCRRLDEAQGRFLFDCETVTGSIVVLPLAGKAWDGVLAIVSNDDERFREEMGTDFLAYLGDIVALVIDPWIRRSHAA